MLLIPKNFKYKKKQKGKAFNIINSVVTFNKLKFGNIGLKSLSFKRLTSRHILTLKQSLKKILKKKGKFKIYVFPHNPITNKSIGVRMGKGKGNVKHWVFNVKPGFILFEISSIYFSLVLKALNTVKLRLPFNTKIVYF